VEGTLSLFDWCPAPAAPSGPVPEGSGPCVQLAEAVEVGASEIRAAPAAVQGPEAGPRIVVFDCETTGTDRIQDQVIELCIQRGLSDDAPSQTWRIKPTAPIHPGAQAVHGITLADLQGSPSFAEIADAIAAVFAETDVIVGYNIAFDIDMLQAEYTRIGRPLLDLNGKKIVDAFRLWQQCEPRSLQHAHQRFVGNGFASAHSASADVAATGRVLTGMLRMFNLADQDWESIACKCDPQYASRASWVGPSRHLRWEGDAVVLGFGKHANAAVHTLAAGPDRSFLRWVVEKDFPVHVGEVCRAALELSGEAFLAWARQRYPYMPAPVAAEAAVVVAAPSASPLAAPTMAASPGAPIPAPIDAPADADASSPPVSKPRASRRNGAKSSSPALAAAPK
jgi:DNA polymerase III subunit epsilon